jgi:hypothetical protein
MKRDSFAKSMIVVLGFALAGDVAETKAQFPYAAPGQSPFSAPQVQPTISPYLNLLRAGNSPSFNYFTLVRPQFDFMNSTYALQQQVATNETSVNNLQFGSSVTTGHPVMFQNLGGYFQSLRGGSGSSGNTQNRSFQAGNQGMAGFNQGAFGNAGIFGNAQTRPR